MLDSGPLRPSDEHLPPEASPPIEDLLADGSLPLRFGRRWRERPAARALRDIDGTWLTAGELEQRSRAAAARLRTVGAAPGERILISGETSADLVVAYIAALRAGLVAVPLNPAYTAGEVARIVRDALPVAAAVDDRARAGLIREVAADHGQAVAISGIELALGGEPSEDGIDQARGEDPALLVYTSGTTGHPKGAVLSHANLLASATSVNLAWRWTPEDVLLLTLPLFHVHGLGVGLIGSLCAGSAVVLRPRFEAGDVADHAGQASMFFGVPTMYTRLARNGQAQALASLRLLVSGSAPLPHELAAQVAEQAGQLPLERYGMTETMMLSSNPYDGARKPGTVGFPLPGVEMRLRDGEVQVKGPNVMSGYRDRPEETAEAFTADGWFRTGDLGEVDDDGYLRLAGRSKELIITGGYNVHPREVEEVLATHPDVREVAVSGRPSPTWGEEVTAFVVARREVRPETLREHAAQELAPYKVPKQIEFIEELPRNAMGKVVRGKLT
jgi:malonyl-CoA/methylmalonyl-CoA synthetase